MWLDPARDAKAQAWALRSRDVFVGDTTPGHYVNEVPVDVTDPVAI